jgi:filamentous hemagglutinin family protein
MMMKTKFWLSFLTLSGLVFTSQIVCAQTYQPTNRTPVADNTLGTQVSGNGNNFDITGGLTKGQTLFHSFTDFSVPTNGQANFLNPAGNRDMITRVTGGLFSDINGTLNSNGANLFLINPNGIVFGANAQLNVGKAFVTSTANGINLVDGSGRGIIFGTNPNGDAPLLTINPDVLFNVSSLTMGGGNGAISNFGTLQTTNDSQYIGLIGGNVNFNGGKIIAPGGRVDIGGLKTNGTVSINGEGLVFNGANSARSDVSIANGSSINVRASQTLNPVDPIFFPSAVSPGSSINISANKLDLSNSGSRFIATTNNSINQASGGLDAGLDVNSGSKTGTVGNIKLDATGDIKIQKSAIFNLVRSGSQGNGGGIKITGNNIAVTDKSEISTNLSENATGRGGDIEINAKGNFDLAQPAAANIRTLALLSTPDSVISANTAGNGNAGKITIAAKGKVLVRDTNTIASNVEATGAGDSGGIKIDASSLTVTNGGQILTFAIASKTGQKGNAGNIDIKTTGDITIFGSKDPTVLKTMRDRLKPLARIASTTFRSGNAGKVTLIAPRKLLVSNRGAIWSQLRENGVGNSGGINLDIGELVISNLSEVSSSLGTYRETINNTKGTAGDINIKATGNITLNEDRVVKTFETNNFAPSMIFSNVFGTGTGGKITIDTPGKVSIGNRAAIDSTVESRGQGNAGGIKITAGELVVFNQGQILTVAANPNNSNPGNSGNIDIKTTGNVTVAGNQNPKFVNEKSDQFIAKIASSSFRNGSAGKIKIEAGGNVLLINRGGIITAQQPTVATIGKSSGDINIKTNQLILDRGNISVDANDKGGNITLTTQDLILMRQNSSISTNSRQGGDGGNIAINSKFLIATKENNDITANAIKGRGGNVQIDAQGVFGIQFRPRINNSTSDITASSDFGRTGNVEIDSLGLDPGRDSTELPNTTTDASKQISQVCSNENRQNKLTVTGRGGLPPTAYDPLTSDVVWQDARAVSSQPAVSMTPVAPLKLIRPAVGWVIGNNGKVTLIAAKEEVQSGSKVVCPKVTGK